MFTYENDDDEIWFFLNNFYSTFAQHVSIDRNLINCPNLCEQMFDVVNEFEIIQQLTMSRSRTK